MTLRLYDSMTREKRAFVPDDPARVTMYVCGPTVYNYAHIGNARPVVVFDVLFRLLRHVFGDNAVAYARNITDIDDKIIKAHQETGDAIEAITEKFANIYAEDMAALGALQPTFTPRATGHIPDMIALVERLVETGAAYAAEGHVLFSIAAFPEYGGLSGANQDEMLAGARVEVAPYKKDAADFVLWKPSTEDEPGWDSPWGRGRPGWHLECSAMIKKVLGPTIDIHGGGHDLRFPHHENEIAQSTCANDGATLANYWMHNGFLTMGEEKMSKSLGNIQTVHELVKDWPGEALRWTLLSAHYRQPLSWTDEAVGQSKRSLDRLYRTLQELRDVQAADVPVPEAFLAALSDDLNTPEAIAALHGLRDGAAKAETQAEKAAAKGALLAAGSLIGLLQENPDAWFQTGGDVDAAAIDKLLEDRAAARKAKDFALADKIRDDLLAQGIVIEDGPGGATWRKA